MLAILDIDGTLVDTNYHHALAWFRAFRRHDITLQLWRIHRHIGMGGDQVVAALTDDATERSCGESIRSSEKQLYSDLIGEVRTMEGSRELITELRRRGHSIVLASSAKADEVEVYLDLLDARDDVDGWTTSADVDATKPAPDLVHAALAMVGAEAGESVLIGDTPWDVKAAAAAGVPTLTVRTGGFSTEELRDSGAAAVFESVAELCAQLDGTVLATPGVLRRNLAAAKTTRSNPSTPPIRCWKKRG